MLRKIEFVNRSDTVSGPSECAIFSTPLNARKNAAICARPVRPHKRRRAGGAYGHVDSDHREAEEGGRVEPLGALRAVAEREQEAGDDQAEVEVLENHVQDVDALAELERRVLHRLAQDDERDVVVALRVPELAP